MFLMDMWRKYRKTVVAMSVVGAVLAAGCGGALAEKLIAADAIFYAPTQPEPLRGPKGYLSIVFMMRAAFSDIQWRLMDCVIEPNKMAVCWECTGTHDGDFMGRPATGKPFKVRCMNFYELRNNQFISDIGNPDILGILMQTGMLQP